MNTRLTARELAVDLLNRSSCAVQVVAVLSDNHGIFAWGWNHAAPNGLGIHAESHAFERANRNRLRGSTLTVAARRKRNGKRLTAYPCLDFCRPLATKHRIKFIEYTVKDGDWSVVYA